MAKSDVERQRDRRRRKKLGLININIWVCKKLYSDIMKVIAEYKG